MYFSLFTPVGLSGHRFLSCGISLVSFPMTTPYSSYGTSGQAAYPASQSTPANVPSAAHFTSVLSSASFADQTPATPGTPTPAPGAAGRGRPRGSLPGAKRGRKPRGALVAGATTSTSPRPFVTNTFNSANANGTAGGASAAPTSTPASFVSAAGASTSAAGQYGKVHWAMSGSEAAGSGTASSGASTDGGVAGGSTGVNADGSSSTTVVGTSDASAAQQNQDASSSNVAGTSSMVIDPALMGAGGTIPGAMNGIQRGTPGPEGPAAVASGLLLPGRGLSQPPGPAGPRLSGVPGLEEEGEGDDELLPAMADDDYSAQLSWQSQSKDNLKYVLGR